MRGLMDDLKAFHEAGDVPVLEAPRWPSDVRIQLRVDLLEEEFFELATAIARREFAEASKELVDLIYVAVGTALEFGIPLDRVWDEVHRSNMSKVDETGKIMRRSDGKILKGRNYVPPDIAKVMEEGKA